MLKKNQQDLELEELQREQFDKIMEYKTNKKMVMSKRNYNQFRFFVLAGYLVYLAVLLYQFAWRIIIIPT